MTGLTRVVMRLLAFVVFLFAATTGGYAAATEGRSPAPAAAGIEDIIDPAACDHHRLAVAIFSETNRMRKENGLPALQRISELEVAADKQAAWMALSLTATHTNPLRAQRTAADRVDETGFHATLVTENVARLPVDSAAPSPLTYASLSAAIVRGWMESKGHRANILNPVVTTIGCAARFARRSKEGLQVFAAQVFCVPTKEEMSLWPPTSALH